MDTRSFLPSIKLILDTVLIEAYIKERNFPAIRLLCAHGAILPAQSVVNQFYTLPHTGEWIDLLLENKSDLGLVNDKSGDTPLMFAVYVQDSARILQLLKAGAKANVTNKHGETIWRYAKDIDVIHTLLGEKVQPDDSEKLFKQIVSSYRGDVSIEILYAGLSALMSFAVIADKETKQDCQNQVYEKEALLHEVVPCRLLDAVPSFTKEISIMIKEYLFFTQKPLKEATPVQKSKATARLPNINR